MRRFRDLMLALAWGVLLFVALDAWRTAHRAQNDLTELAAMIWTGALVLGGVAGAIAYLRIARWNRRFEGEQCPACGYDLRATPERCPECGFATTSTESNFRAWLNATALDYARDRHTQSTRVGAKRERS